MARIFWKTSLRSLLDVLASIAVIAAAGVLIYRMVFTIPGGGPPELEVPPEPLSIDGAPLRGSEDAEVVMIIYSDFQCPFCGRFARDVLPELERRYIAPGKVAIAFRHLPLAIHPRAFYAAALAECGGEQEKFWEVHDVLFAQQGVFTQQNIDDEMAESLLASVELDRDRFDECLKDVAVEKAVQASVDQAKELGIGGTPAFFLGKRLGDGRVRVLRALAGALPVDDFVEALEGTFVGVRTGWRSWIPFVG